MAIQEINSPRSGAWN